jgi:hypothetical protein
MVSKRIWCVYLPHAGCVFVLLPFGNFDRTVDFSFIPRHLMRLARDNDQLDLATLDGRIECFCLHAVVIQETADIQGQDVSDLHELSDVQSAIPGLVF